MTMSVVMGFLELGIIILAWTIVWQFVLKGITGIHGDAPAAQGFAAIYHA